MKRTAFGLILLVSALSAACVLGIGPVDCNDDDDSTPDASQSIDASCEKESWDRHATIEWIRISGTGQSPIPSYDKVAFRDDLLELSGTGQDAVCFAMLDGRGESASLWNGVELVEIEMSGSRLQLWYEDPVVSWYWVGELTPRMFDR